jgi:tetratricopeptide (TPR) repeat protein/predicted aspartyl protease
MRRPLTMLAVLSVLLAGRTAAECKLVKMADLPVTMVGLKPTVTAKINGVDAQFIADSGAFFSMLSPAATAGYKLTQTPASYGVQGIGGRTSASMTTVNTFTLAGIPFPKVQFLVADFGSGAAGLLGQNVFSIGDVEYDLANGSIKLWHTDGCGHAVLAYWLPSKSDGYSLMEINSATPRLPHTIGSAYINGAKITVLFDTGMPRSMLTLSAAKRAGITPDSPGVSDGGTTYGIGQGVTKAWIGSFPSFKIGDEEIRNARLRFGNVEFPEADMLIGADFFLSHRIYVARDLHRLFFTYNGGPVFNLKPPEPPAASDSTAGAASPPAATGEPADAAEFSRRGNAYAARHDYEHAIADLTRACELAPGEASYFYQRALVRWDNKQPDLAMTDLDRSLELKPSDVRALMARAELRLRAGDVAGATTDLEAADRYADYVDDIRLDIARNYERAGLFAQAKVQYDLWIPFHPNDARVFTALSARCWLGASSGQDLAAALTDCNTVARRMDKSNPANWAILAGRGTVRLRMGDRDQAVADFNSTLKQLPKNAWALYGRGVAKERQGKTAEAQGDMAAATALQPEIADTFKKRGITP